ncbi:MAG: Dam family site-specific DNA-(adenine-N6)-methyltransferase [Paraburkholderia sp.]|uniref:DNA adenine methylase n=1 Tax=Paraburkholderia sp. TaxID=1926495 RepID=UPI003C51F646
MGGKSRLLAQLLPALPRGSRLIEPFFGGAAVFLATNFSDYLLGDSNPHLIELYRTVAQQLEQFIEMALPFFNEGCRSKERFLEIRSTFNEANESLHRAAQFLYLNKFGFNGLCRYNRSGQFNVPYGHHVRLPRFPREEIMSCAKKAQRATFVHADFASVMRMARSGDVVYCDPPYLDRDGAASFRAYSPGEFCFERQRELANLARELAERGIPVAISNHDCAAAREIYSGATILDFSVRRSVSASSDSRGQIAELLAVFGRQSERVDSSGAGMVSELRFIDVQYRLKHISFLRIGFVE